MSGLTEESSLDIVLIGAGGHASVVLEILQHTLPCRVVGCTHLASANNQTPVPSLGDDKVLPELYENGLRHAFIGIGDNELRLIVAQQVTAIGYSLVNAVSSASYVSPSATLGCGIAVMPCAAIQTGVVVSDGAIINTSASVDHHSWIGEFCHVAPGCHIAGNVIVEDGAFLGVGASVIPGVKVGANSVVGAGAVVIRDIPANTIVAGVPAQIIAIRH